MGRVKELLLLREEKDVLDEKKDFNPVFLLSNGEKEGQKTLYLPKSDDDCR